MVGELRDDATGCAARAKAWGTPHRAASAVRLIELVLLTSFGYVLLLVRLLADVSLGVGGDCGSGHHVRDHVGRLSINPLCIKKELYAKKFA